MKTSTTEVWISRTLSIHSSNILFKLIQRSFCDNFITPTQHIFSCFEIIFHFKVFLLSTLITLSLQQRTPWGIYGQPKGGRSFSGEWPFQNIKNILLNLLFIGDWCMTLFKISQLAWIQWSENCKLWIGDGRCFRPELYPPKLSRKRLDFFLAESWISLMLREKKCIERFAEILFKLDGLYFNT